MFGPHKDIISLGATPERVYFCAQYLRTRREKLKRDDFYDSMCMPKEFGDNKDYFNKSLNVLEQLSLMEEADKMVSGTENLAKITSPDAFRRYAARKVFQWEDSLFFLITESYCEHAEEFLKCSKKDEIPGLLESYGVKIKNFNDMLSWRLWAPWLGCGYLNGDYMIPNWHQRIADLLYDQKEFQPGEEVPISQFMKWVTLKAGETAKSVQGTQIGLGLSNGLRTLHELKKLEIISVPDASQWQLVRTSGLSQISHVRIREVKA